MTVCVLREFGGESRIRHNEYCITALKKNEQGTFRVQTFGIRTFAVSVKDNERKYARLLN